MMPGCDEGTMNTLRLIHDAHAPDEAELRAIGRKDRRRALDLVVRAHRDRLFQHAAYITKDFPLAMDVVQEVFIKAMREPRFFDEDFKMKAWLFRVTSNLCFNLVRDRRRRTAILDAAALKDSSDANQVEMVFTSEAQASILEAMERLTEAHKEILMLRYYSDLSYAEIADTLGVKLGTVMSRLSRAKTELLGELQSNDGLNT